VCVCVCVCVCCRGDPAGGGRGTGGMEEGRDVLYLPFHSHQFLCLPFELLLATSIFNANKALLNLNDRVREREKRLVERQKEIGSTERERERERERAREREREKELDGLLALR